MKSKQINLEIENLDSKLKSLKKVISSCKANFNELTLPQISSKRVSINAQRRNKSLSAYNLVDFSMGKVKYKAEPLKYLSSKIDFFDSENQRKLDVSKRKILLDVGGLPLPPKAGINRAKIKNNLTPQLHTLVEKYFRKKSQRQSLEGDYVPMGAQNLYYF